MNVKIKLPEGVATAFTSTGSRFMADPEGCVECAQYSQDHYDLLEQGGVVVEAPEEPPASVAKTTEQVQAEQAEAAEAQRIADEMAVLTQELAAVNDSLANETDADKKAALEGQKTILEEKMAALVA